MKRLILCAILGVLGTAPAMFADVVDYLLNVNGALYCDEGSGVANPCTGSGGPSTNSGLAAAGATGTLDTSLGGTGEGTVSLSFTPGSYDVGLWLFENIIPVSSYDEYGATGGSPATGESWQIDTPDYAFVGDPNTSATGTIIANTVAGTLSDSNDVPGQTDSITGCFTPDPTCNDYTSLALGQSFTVDPGYTGTLTFDVSETKPTSGFYLEQIDPGEVTGTPAAEYFTESFSETPTCTVNCSPVPEPSSWIPLVAFAGILVVAVRRRSAAV
jgi:opacity protein-like surface antigen